MAKAPLQNRKTASMTPNSAQVAVEAFEPNPAGPLESGWWGDEVSVGAAAIVVGINTSNTLEGYVKYRELQNTHFRSPYVYFEVEMITILG